MSLYTGLKKFKELKLKIPYFIKEKKWLYIFNHNSSFKISLLTFKIIIVKNSNNNLLLKDSIKLFYTNGIDIKLFIK